MELMFADDGPLCICQARDFISNDDLQNLKKHK